MLQGVDIAIRKAVPQKPTDERLSNELIRFCLINDVSKTYLHIIGIMHQLADLSVSPYIYLSFEYGDHHICMKLLI